MSLSTRGFTLIEVMIVVAIVGLLAALAIPNFTRFQVRARQSEAKTNLKAVFTAEKSFYGDKQMYLDLVDVVGFAPEYGNRYEYLGGGGGVDTRASSGAAPVLGPSVACPSLSGVGIVNTDQTRFPGTGVGAGWAAFVVGNRQSNLNSLVGGVTTAGVANGPGGACCPAGQCEFLAEALANIDNDQTLDGWAIGSQGSPLGAGDTQVCEGGPASGTTGTFSEGEPVNECNDVEL